MKTSPISSVYIFLNEQKFLPRLAISANQFFILNYKEKYEINKNLICPLVIYFF